MSLPVEAYRLPGISPRAYQHPADRAATAALGRIPYLDQVVRQLVALGYERALRAVSLGSAVRLGQDQLPGVWVLHRQACNALDIEQVPDLYLTQFPFANAAAIGTKKPIVVVNSELVRLLDDDGRRAVLAHEAGHVHSDHVLYHTALIILLQIGTRRTGMGWVRWRSLTSFVSLSAPEPPSSYSLACAMNASSDRSSAAAPAASTISDRQTASGSRVTSAAARSHESSAARNHSSSASWIAISGRPASSGRRTEPAMRRRMSIAVW